MLNCKYFLTSKNTRNLIFLASLTCIIQPALSAEGDLSAKEIMMKVDDRYQGDTSKVNSTLFLIDSRENQRTRNIVSYSKEFDDHSKNVAYITSPANLRGIAVLSYNWDSLSKEDDSWLYLPAIQQTKRVATVDKSGPFFGGDFTLSDVEGVQLEWYDFKLLSESVEVNGEECWHIEYTPLMSKKKMVEDATNNFKSEVWVTKNHFIVVRGKYWVTEGNKIKYFMARDLQLVDGAWMIGEVQMVLTKNEKTRHRSIIKNNNFLVNGSVGDELFRSDYLKELSN